MSVRERPLSKVPSAAGMTVQVGEIQQRLPPKRRKPSLPAVSLEGTTKGRAKPSIEPVAIPVRQHIVEEMVEHVGAGQEPQRSALAQLEKLYQEVTP